MTKQLTFKNGISIEWNHGDDGGGSTQYVDFLNAISDGKKYKKGLEWCAGLSAIAFSLLDANICENFTLMDIYEPALQQAKENAEINKIYDKVNYYVCDQINTLPNSEKFDLVVANPPHCIDDDWIPKISYETIYRLTVDLDWQLHKEFYENITNYLNPNADVYISHVIRHTLLDEYITNSGLTFIKEVPAKQLSIDSNTDAFITHYRYETEVH